MFRARQSRMFGNSPARTWNGERHCRTACGECVSPPHSRMQRVWPTPRGIVFGPRSTTSIPKHCIVSCTIRVGASITHEDPPKFAVHANTNSPAHRMGRMHKTPSCSVHKILHWTCARSSLSDDAVGGGAMCVRAEESTHSCVQTLQICEKESPWQCGSRGRVAWGAKKFPVPPLALPFLALIRVSVPRALATTVCCPTFSRPTTCPPARAHWGDGQRARGSARRFLRRSWVGRFKRNKG